MAIYEYFCETCQLKFEQITSQKDPEAGKCPKCGGKKTKKQISKFAVAGQGDLRESTMHGCHDNFNGNPDAGGGGGGGCGNCPYGDGGGGGDHD